MLQRQGVFLERGMPVGKRWMTGIARLGGKTEIRQLQPLQAGQLHLTPGVDRVLRMTGMQQQQAKKRQIDRGKQQKLD